MAVIRGFEVDLVSLQGDKKAGFTVVGDMEGCAHFKIGMYRLHWSHLFQFLHIFLIIIIIDLIN